MSKKSPVNAVHCKTTIIYFKPNITSLTLLGLESLAALQPDALLALTDVTALAASLPAPRLRLALPAELTPGLEGE